MVIKTNCLPYTGCVAVMDTSGRSVHVVKHWNKLVLKLLTSFTSRKYAVYVHVHVILIPSGEDAHRTQVPMCIFMCPLQHNSTHRNRSTTKKRIRPKEEPVTPTQTCPMQCTCQHATGVVECNTIILILVFVSWRIHVRGALHIESDRYINDVYIHFNPNKRHRDGVYPWLLHMEWLYIESTKTRHTGTCTSSVHVHLHCFQGHFLLYKKWH